MQIYPTASLTHAVRIVVLKLVHVMLKEAARKYLENSLNSLPGCLYMHNIISSVTYMDGQLW